MARPLDGVFVTGTDTGVGKTTVSIGLLRAARRRGLAPIPFKPAETGCDPDPADAHALWHAAQPPIDPASVCLYSLRLPAAPDQAAAAEGVEIDIDRILAHARDLSRKGDFLLVEGAGGLLVPYTPEATAVELAAQLDLPLLVVARTALGTINHTALTLREAARHGLSIAGLVFNRTTNEPQPHEAGNGPLIARLTGHRALGTLPWIAGGAGNDPNALADALETALGQGAPNGQNGSDVLARLLEPR
jgi:dethiobiotin synthetase